MAKIRVGKSGESFVTASTHVKSSKKHVAKNPKSPSSTIGDTVKDKKVIYSAEIGKAGSSKVAREGVEGDISSHNVKIPFNMSLLTKMCGSCGVDDTISKKGLPGVETVLSPHDSMSLSSKKKKSS